jgi:hypothetical protein
MSLHPLVLLLVPLVFIQPWSRALAENTSVYREGRCDIPKGEMQVLKQTDLPKCKDACSLQAGCKGFVHISGWNRCRLLTLGQPQFAIRFHSSEKAENQLMKDPKIDHDYTGKDLRKVETKDLDLCLEACKNTKECLAVTYIEGYKACWLKKTAGRYLEKVFTCGVKV